MKILHIGFQDFGGGAAESMMRIHQGLLELNVDSAVLVFRKKTKTDKTYGYTEKTHHYYAALRREILRKPLQLFFPELKNNYFSLNIFPSILEKTIRSYKPDILNIHWINSESMSIYALNSIAKNIVWTLHDLWPVQGIFHLKIPNIENQLLKRVDKYFEKKKKIMTTGCYYIAPSRMIRDEIVQNKKINKDRTFIIPNSVDNRIFKPKGDKKKRILFIGNTVIKDYNKGFDLLDSSCNELINRIDDFELHIVGDNTKIAKTNYKLIQHGPTNNKQKLSKFYSEAAITVIPSRFENFPLVALESLSSGTPVVAFDVGGISEIIFHKINGWLVPPFDIQLFAKGIEYFLKYDLPVTKKCQNSVKSYTILQVSKHYMNAYRKIVNANK